MTLAACLFALGCVVACCVFVSAVLGNQCYLWASSTPLP